MIFDILKPHKKAIFNYLRTTGMHHVEVGQQVYMVDYITGYAAFSARISPLSTIINKKEGKSKTEYKLAPKDRFSYYEKVSNKVPAKSLPTHVFFSTLLEAEEYVACLNTWKAIEPHL